MLMNMSDERLWHTLRMFVSGMGMELPERKRWKINYDAVRYTLSQINEDDLVRIGEITDMYKGYRKGGFRR